MQRSVLLTLAALLVCLPAAGAAASDCALREARLQARLAAARQQGNGTALAGLETALKEARRWCRDPSPLGRAHMLVQERRADVAEQELELWEVKAAGRADGVARRERRLREAQKALRDALTARDALGK